MQVPAVREISRDGTGDGTLTSRTGSSFILQWHHQFNLVQAGGKGWAPGEHVFSYQSFLCFLFLFYFCADAVYQSIVMSGSHVTGPHQSASSFRISGNALFCPSVSPPS